MKKNYSHYITIFVNINKQKKQWKQKQKIQV